jgi:hypothetical protein
MPSKNCRPYKIDAVKSSQSVRPIGRDPGPSARTRQWPTDEQHGTSRREASEVHLTNQVTKADGEKLLGSAAFR